MTNFTIRVLCGGKKHFICQLHDGVNTCTKIYGKYSGFAFAQNPHSKIRHLRKSESNYQGAVTLSCHRERETLKWGQLLCEFASTFLVFDFDCLFHTYAPPIVIHQNPTSGIKRTNIFDTSYPFIRPSPSTASPVCLILAQTSCPTVIINSHLQLPLSPKFSQKN